MKLRGRAMLVIAAVASAGYNNCSADAPAPLSVDLSQTVVPVYAVVTGVSADGQTGRARLDLRSPYVPGAGYSFEPGVAGFRAVLSPGNIVRPQRKVSSDTASVLLDDLPIPQPLAPVDYAVELYKVNLLGLTSTNVGRLATFVGTEAQYGALTFTFDPTVVDGTPPATPFAAPAVRNTRLGVQLTWSAFTDPAANLHERDLYGWYLERDHNGAGFQRLTSTPLLGTGLGSDLPADYLDEDVASGDVVSYCLVAVDLSDNESACSAASTPLTVVRQ